MEEQEKIIASGDAEEVKGESARRTRRSFLAGGAAAAAGYGLWRWIDSGRVIGRQPIALRRTFQTDASIARSVFSERGLAPEYPIHRAVDLRLNGTIGMDQQLKLDSWRLQLVGSANAKASPRYVPDVTAWDYEYEGDTPADAQATDVKSAPGNGGGSKTGSPKDQKSSSGIKDGQVGADVSAEHGADVGAGSGQPAQDAVNASHNLSASAPKVNGLPHVDLAERFNKMAQEIARKKNIGDDEAGPSASSLDIGTPGLLLTMADLMKLPRVEHVFEFHCIEGWSQIVHWSGVRLRDLIEMYPPEKISGREPRYVYMETPDGNYYGGYDLNAARHPQSLLVTEIGGKPLTQEHGAPLRLFMPLKYGYKNVKRIGLIAYTDTRPDDYWTKLGYDWYAGL